MDHYQGWPAVAATTAPAPSPEQWLEAWFRLADDTLRDAPPGPSARAILEADRNRLEPENHANPSPL